MDCSEEKLKLIDEKKKLYWGKFEKFCEENNQKSATMLLLLNIVDREKWNALKLEVET
ncbi:MAG TPA: hypothetical protein VHP32_08760 [Ignavibacteria bacterium]|nr:hypothetical protein [Ignavibacteria bacterium]